MTQEKLMRRMLESFITDPPDTDYQQGFLAGALVIAVEIMNVEWNDPLILAANELIGPDKPNVQETITKAKASLTVIEGGKSSVTD